MLFERSRQIWSVPIDGSRPATQLFFARGDNGSAVYSPDGSKLAFVSNRNTHAIIGIFQDSTKPIQWIAPSTDRDASPRWSADGGSLYYRNETELMVVAVDKGTTFAPKPPALVFGGIYNMRSATGISYAVAPSGDRFLMVRLTEEGVASTLTVVANWFAELRRVTAAPR